MATLAGRGEILGYNPRGILVYAANDGAVLWEYPWGKGFPHVAVPVIVGPNRVVFSAGYGVGAELLEITPTSGAGCRGATPTTRRRHRASS